MLLTPISYNYKGDKIVGDSLDIDSLSTDLEEFYRRDTVTTHLGLTAQNLELQFPELVTDLGNMKAINYVELVPVLIKGIQEQQVKIDSQSLEIVQLRQEIENWKGCSLDTSGQSQTRLFQNHPNPFNGNTTIDYFIDENTFINDATIEIRDIMGNLKNTLTLTDRSGLGNVEYNGSQLTQGYYIYTLKVNSSVMDSKMFLIE